MARYALGATVVALVVIGGMYLLNTRGPAPSYTWNVQGVGYRADNQAPLNSINVRSNITSVMYPLPGNYMGSCVPIENTSEKLSGDELSAIICTWGKSGTEVGVFQIGTTRYIGEITRTDVSPSTPFGVRDPSNLQTLVTLNAGE